MGPFVEVGKAKLGVCLDDSRFPQEISGDSGHLRVLVRHHNHTFQVGLLFFESQLLRSVNVHLRYYQPLVREPRLPGTCLSGAPSERY